MEVEIIWLKVGVYRPKYLYGINKNPNYILDFLTKVLPKAASGLARRSGNETNGVE